MVRGMDENWLKNVYGIALEPDAVFYLNVPPEELVQRNFAKNLALDAPYRRATKRPAGQVNAKAGIQEIHLCQAYSNRTIKQN